MFGDYLDKAPGVDVTEDTIFSSRSQAELFLAACYEQAIQGPWADGRWRYGDWNRPNNIQGNLASFVSKSEEAEHTAVWYMSQPINDGTLTITPNYDNLFHTRWTGLRYVNIMIDRIYDVPTADQAWKDNISAEAHFLRAHLSFENLKRYGGMPIVDRRFESSEFESTFIPRSSVASYVEFLVSDLDYAIGKLPDSYISQWRGRATKGAALALKSRVLLHAASKRFNQATPVLSMEDPANDSMLCYGNYDINRWKRAADAAKAVLDWAPSGGIKLIDNQGVDKNYRYSWEVNDNEEIILAAKQTNGDWKNVSPYSYWLHARVGGGAGPMPTQNFVEYAYDRTDGTPQVWENAGTDLAGQYVNLDPRFHQTIAYNGFFWNQQRGVLNMALGPPPAGPHSAGNVTGYFIKKHVPDAINAVANRVPKNFTLYQLNEIYLNYAEALNEFEGPVTAAYDAINTIRARSGMPALPAGLTKEQFRERVRKERATELAFDGHRWWDILRWQIGDEVINGPFYGLKIYKNEPITNPFTFRYEKYQFETRVWQDRFYFYFFTNNSLANATNEVNKGYLVQNPGW